jgi:hypothetical protein
MLKQLVAVVLTGAVAWVVPAPRAQAQGDFGKEAHLRTATLDEVRAQVAAWLDEMGASQELRDQIQAQWQADLPDPSGPQLLERLAASFSLADPRARNLAELCSQPREVFILPDLGWLKDPTVPAFLRNHMSLIFGRWAVQEKLFDEGLTAMGDLKPVDVLDPASLLFYQGVACHRLLEKKRGLEAIGQLLEDVIDPPQRYVSVAGLMQDDLAALKDESLDHISRRMEDVERRLDLGHAGQKVQRIEDGIIKSLEKLIEEIEQQQQQQQQQQSQAGGPRSVRPAGDSNILPGQGPGQVDPKNIGSRSGWGDLPPKKRQEALQQVGKDFPSHYRDIIEQYFRRIASEEGQRR